jgi:DNA repair exonuclease SbcCD ATPase subunit
MQQQAEICETQERLRVLEQEKARVDSELEELRDAIDARKAEAEREHRRRERLEKDLRDLKNAVEQRCLEVKQKGLQIEAAEEQQVCSFRPLETKLQYPLEINLPNTASICNDLYCFTQYCFNLQRVVNEVVEVPNLLNANVFYLGQPR